jgi:predicted ribosomally synthesized peptide with SipW-like signal peptide
MDQTAYPSGARRTKRRRALLAVLLSASLAMLGAGAMTLAQFTDSEASSGSWTTGTIVLGVSPATSFSANSIMPGAGGSQTITVDNNGTGALRYTMTTSADNADGKGLAAQLDLTIQAGTCAAPGATLYSGSLDAAFLGDNTQGDDPGDRTVAAGASDSLCFSWDFRWPAATATRTPPRPPTSPSTPSRPRTTRNPDRPARPPRAGLAPSRPGCTAARPPGLGARDMPIVALATRAPAGRSTSAAAPHRVRPAMLVLARVLPAATGGTTFVVGGPRWSRRSRRSAASPARRPGGPARGRRRQHPRRREAGRVHPPHRPPGDAARRPVPETRGDGNEDPDPALVPASSVVGRVAFHVPFAGYGLALPARSRVSPA